MGYDEKCWDLAVAFLSDDPEKDTSENRGILAQTIQNAIETELEFGLKPPRKNGDPCPSCKQPFFDGGTCSRGGCPLGGDF